MRWQKLKHDVHVEKAKSQSITWIYRGVLKMILDEGV
jgi:hypothetical protein